MSTNRVLLQPLCGAMFASVHRGALAVPDPDGALRCSLSRSMQAAAFVATSFEHPSAEGPS